MAGGIRKQLTLRLPDDVWTWVKLYHRVRRDELEDGPSFDVIKVSLQDIITDLVREGLKHLHPLSGVLIADEDPGICDKIVDCPPDKLIPGTIVHSHGED